MIRLWARPISASANLAAWCQFPNLPTNARRIDLKSRYFSTNLMGRIPFSATFSRAVGTVAAALRYLAVANFVGESALVTSRSWTPEQVECLEKLLANKVSPARAAVILRRSIVSVQVKARALGKPFPNMRKERVGRNAAAAAFSENRTI